MIKVTKRQHPVWLEWLKIKQTHPEILSLHYNTPIVGQCQYFYENEKTRIRLIELPDFLHDGVDFWEICGGGLTDCERFLTKQEAEKRIRELLD